MTRAELLAFVRKHRLAVQASVTPLGGPQAAVVGIAVSDAFEIVFDTLTTSRKFRNLCADQRIALVIGWDEEVTVQIEGVADFPKGDELERVCECYFAAHPDGRERLAWPGIAHVRVRPVWVRYSEFGSPTGRIVEFTADELVPGGRL